MHWVGGTDLSVEFLVTDAESGQPISEARIEIESYGGLYQDRDEKEFTLTADAAGVARKECKENLCSGKQSGLNLNNTFHVALPDWRYRVVAKGYNSGDWIFLSSPEPRRNVQRVGVGKTRLVIPVQLPRSEIK